MFGAVKLTKYSDIDKYKYLGYGIGFDGRGTFLFPNDSFGQNVIRFGVNMYMLITRKNILILGEGLTQELDETILTAEKKYSINFTTSRKKFCLS